MCKITLPTGRTELCWHLYLSLFLPALSLSVCFCSETWRENGGCIVELDRGSSPRGEIGILAAQLSVTILGILSRIVMPLSIAVTRSREEYKTMFMH